MAGLGGQVTPSSLDAAFLPVGFMFHMVTIWRHHLHHNVLSDESSAERSSCLCPRTPRSLFVPYCVHWSHGVPSLGLEERRKTMMAFHGASALIQQVTVEEMKAAKTWDLLPTAGEEMFEGQTSSMSNAPFQHFWCKMSLYEMMMMTLSLISLLAKIVVSVHQCFLSDSRNPNREEPLFKSDQQR